MLDSDRRTGQRGTFRESFGIGWLSFVSNGLISLVASVVTARIYGIEVVGEFALAYAAVAIVWQLSTHGEQVGLMRSLSDAHPRDPRVTVLFWPVFAFSTALTLVVCLVAVFVSYLLFNGPVDNPDLFLPSTVMLAAYLLLANPGWNLDTVLVAFNAARPLLAIRLHQVVISLVVAIAATAFLDSVWGLVLATCVPWVTSLLHRAVIIPRYMVFVMPARAGGEDRAELRDILSFGVKTTPGTLAAGVSNEVGTWIAGVTSGVSSVGAFSRAWFLARRFLELQMRVREMLFPTLNERGARGDLAGFDRAVVDSLRYVALFLCLPAAVGGGAAEAIMAIYGEEFTRGATALAILLLVPTFAAMTTVQATALFAKARPLTSSAWGLLRLAVTLAASGLFGAWWGIEGVALGILAGVVIQFVLQVFTTRQYLHGPIRDLWPARQVLGTAVAYAAGFLVARVIDDAIPGVVAALPALAAGSAAYAAGYLLVAGLLPRDRQRATAVWRSMRARRQAPEATA